MGGRTDADTIREILDGQPLARRNPGDPGGQAREDADAALDRLEARLVAVEDALGKIAGKDPRGFLDGIHFVGDETKPEECPGCIARDALAAAADTGQGTAGDA